MFDTIFGLPVHSLVVHGVVVIIPLAAAGLIVLALRPAWRRAYLPLVVALSTIGLVMVPVATQSGKALRERVNAGGVVAKQINDHVQAGGRVLIPTLLMWALSVALLVLTRRRRTGRPVTIVAGLGAVAALLALAAVAIAGHLGSTAVWGCVVGGSACPQ